MSSKLSLDTLFGGTETADDQVAMIDDTLIDEFEGHPYRLYTGKRQADLLESIKELGVVTPIIVRAENNGRYTLLAGYNRRSCNQLAGNKQIPAVVKHDICDGEAKLIITHSNRQRGLSELLPSEKAFAFKMELEGLKETRKQLKKVAAIEEIKGEQDCNSNLFNFEQKDFSRDNLAKNHGISSVEVHRLIRLTHLIPQLLDLVDENKIADYVAVPLTYLDGDSQEIIFSLIKDNGYKLDIEKAELIKQEFKNKESTSLEIEDILSGKNKKLKPKEKLKPVKIETKIIKKYFSNNENPKEIQSIIGKALDMYFAIK